jgi:hypothetical protein
MVKGAEDSSVVLVRALRMEVNFYVRGVEFVTV